MRPPIKLFVSHSSRDNALTRDVCGLISSQAKNEVEVLVDLDNLEDGRPWPAQLHEMLADCHAALVLLTGNAVPSEWVLKEATILTWRHTQEPGFKLFIAQSPSVTEAQLQAGKFGPLQHRLIQGIASDDAAHVTERVLTALRADAAPADETLFDRLVAALADILRTLSNEALDRLARKLGSGQPRWRPDRAGQRALIESIATTVLRGSLGQFGSLTDLMNELRTGGLTREPLRSTLRFLGPHWVDVEAAALLGDLVEEQAGEKRLRPAALNGNHVRDYTGRMYVERAFPLLHECKVFAPTPAAAGNEHEDYTKKICDHCRTLDNSREHPLYKGKSDDEIVTHLRHRRPFLFVFLPSSVDPQEFSLLRLSFPRVHFVLHTGPTLDPAPHESVVYLKPALRTDIEQTQYYAYCDAMEVT